MVVEHTPDHGSQWAAIRSISQKIGCTAETLRKWVRRVERDEGVRPGLTTDERERLKDQEREIRELKQRTRFCARRRRISHRRSSNRGDGGVYQDKMVEEMKTCHYFLHTAIKDPCPNAIFEAICMGLPVIFNPAIGSSPEIVGDIGLALQENDLASTIRRARVQLLELREILLTAIKTIILFYQYW